MRFTTSGGLFGLHIFGSRSLQYWGLLVCYASRRNRLLKPGDNPLLFYDMLNRFFNVPMFGLV